MVKGRRETISVNVQLMKKFLSLLSTEDNVLLFFLVQSLTVPSRMRQTTADASGTTSHTTKLSCSPVIAATRCLGLSHGVAKPTEHGVEQLQAALVGKTAYRESVCLGPCVCIVGYEHNQAI